jgi:hypothetical protein
MDRQNYDITVAIITISVSVVSVTANRIILEKINFSR